MGTLAEIAIAEHRSPSGVTRRALAFVELSDAKTQESHGRPLLSTIGNRISKQKQVRDG